MSHLEDMEALALESRKAICKLEQELMMEFHEEYSKEDDKENIESIPIEKDEKPESKEDAEEEPVWKPSKYCVPIRADVRNFNFKDLVQCQLRATGRKFDVIMTDPPWQLATANPTRGVALGYQQLSDS